MLSSSAIGTLDTFSPTLKSNCIRVSSPVRAGAEGSAPVHATCLMNASPTFQGYALVLLALDITYDCFLAYLGTPGYSPSQWHRKLHPHVERLAE